MQTNASTYARLRAGALGRGRPSPPAPAFSPASLPGIAPSLSVALQRSGGLLWQDAAKTVPAVADGDPVRVATCPYTAVDFTAPSDAARPLLWDELQDGVYWSLAFDGVDDGFDVAITLGTAGAIYTALLAASAGLLLANHVTNDQWRVHSLTQLSTNDSVGSQTHLVAYPYGSGFTTAWVRWDGTEETIGSGGTAIDSDGTPGHDYAFTAFGYYPTVGIYFGGRIASSIHVGTDRPSDAEHALTLAYLAGLTP